jgi:hypothetical protein
MTRAGPVGPPFVYFGYLYFNYLYFEYFEPGRPNGMTIGLRGNCRGIANPCG